MHENIDTKDAVDSAIRTSRQRKTLNINTLHTYENRATQSTMQSLNTQIYDQKQLSFKIF